MTTYELPPEPPIGSRVRAGVDELTRGKDGWTGPAYGLTYSWPMLLGLASPLTLIEPDPLPTAPLIVATREGAHLTPVRRVWARSDEVRSIYMSITDSHEAHPGDTLTNVVPVTVAPVAEWEAWRTVHQASTSHLHGCSACALIAATDALGVDL